ncbi:MAG: GTP pyrophosphokinase family protein [Clostridiales bacterium]|nr:GTP pyrophosphokinase family protein [Clostridiales bacterium]
MKARLDKDETDRWMQSNAIPYKELMTYYRCALMNVESKFKVLNEEFSLSVDRNPIESIKSRLKTPESILDKMIRNNYPLSIETIEDKLNDIAGVRVICSFKSDIYDLARALGRQDDVTVIKTKDYIADPKPNGYRSLHLVIAVPIFLQNEKRMMKVEVQLRTLAMDMWASIEHKIKYKKNVILTPEDANTLRGCSELSDMLDNRMEELYLKLQ